MLLKFICCDVFARIAASLTAASPHIVDADFVPMLAHTDPAELKRLISEKIEAAGKSGRPYDAVILGFGLCGNAVIGLSSPITMVIPRAHDCCTIHMGSKENFLAEFGGSLSMKWGSTGYYERTRAIDSSYSFSDQPDNYKTSAEYMEYSEQYDEETAEYLWQTLHPKTDTKESVYIKIDGYEYSDSFECYKSEMDKADIRIKVVEGNISLLKALTDGEWDDDRFLVIPPGKSIAGVYDMDQVVKAE